MDNHSEELTLELFNKIGKFPFLEGKKWDDPKFNLKETIDTFRKSILNNTPDFWKDDINDNEIEVYHNF